MHFGQCPSPLGMLRFQVDDLGRLCQLDLTPAGDARTTAADHPACRLVTRQLTEYFAGTRQTFALPVALPGTPFQVRAWQQLQQIPYGTTISYGEQARRLGRPGAVRAIGQANGRNPVPIVVPCHRVVAADGGLGGFRGGLRWKQWLLQLERETRARAAGAGAS